MAKKVIDETHTVEVVAEPEVPQGAGTADTAPPEPPLQLVTDPGMKKVIVFHGTGEAEPDAEAAPAGATDSPPATFGEGPPASPAPARLPNVGPEVDRLGARGGGGSGPTLGRTVFRTERGSEVRSYETLGSSRRTLTLTRSGEEVPFRSSMVDDVVGRDEPAPVPEATEAPKEEKARRRFGFFGRREPKPEFHPDGKGDPGVEHVYQTAVPVDKLDSPAEPAPAQSGWEPEQKVIFTEKPAPAARSRPERRPRRRTTPAVQPRRATRMAKRAAKPRKAKRAPKRRKAKRAAKPRTVLSYPGDNHPIIDVEGIGPTFAKRLGKAGIATTGQLAVARPGRIAKATRAPPKTVKGWQAQAELLKVEGVGPQFAEAMARSGIRGISDLKAKPAGKLASRVEKYLAGLDVKIVGQGIGPKRMAQWKRRAARMRKVRVSPKELATPTHGLPPPWLREGAGAKGKAGKGGKAAGKAGKAARNAGKAGKAAGRTGKRASRAPGRRAAKAGRKGSR